MGEPRRVSTDELGRLGELLASGEVQHGDLLIHEDGRTLKVHGSALGYGFETVGWADGQFAPKPARDGVLAQQEERLTRLERHEQVVTDSLDAGRRELRDLGELVQQERADRLNMARQLIELEQAATLFMQVGESAAAAIERVAARVASEEADNRNARRRLGEVELKADEIARRLHLGEPGYDFPWPPIPRENDGAPTVRDLERDTDDRLSENAVTWPISKRRWEMQHDGCDDPHCGVGNELHPAFQITVDLDGDDDADTQTANARRALEDCLEQAAAGGLIRGWTLDGA